MWSKINWFCLLTISSTLNSLFVFIAQLDIKLVISCLLLLFSEVNGEIDVI